MREAICARWTLVHHLYNNLWRGYDLTELQARNVLRRAPGKHSQHLFHFANGIVILSILFPLILYFGGLWWGGIHDLATSMSAYYGENDGTMRNWFVGILWTVGSFLYLYKGFSELENILLNLAGGFAVATAMIPCHCWTGLAQSNKLHAIVAISFFISMALVCLLCANDTISLLPEKKDQDAFRRRYRTIGAVLLASPLAAVIMSYALGQNNKYKFFVEAFGVWTFAYYWLTKSREFRITSVEKRAAHGMLENAPARGVVPVAK